MRCLNRNYAHQQHRLHDMSFLQDFKWHVTIIWTNCSIWYPAWRGTAKQRAYSLTNTMLPGCIWSSSSTCNSYIRISFMMRKISTWSCRFSHQWSKCFTYSMSRTTRRRRWWWWFTCDEQYSIVSQFSRWSISYTNERRTENHQMKTMNHYHLK